MKQLMILLAIGFYVQDARTQPAAFSYSALMQTGPGLLQAKPVDGLGSFNISGNKAQIKSVGFRFGALEYAEDTVPVEVKEDTMIWGAAYRRNEAGLTQLRLAVSDIDFLISTTRFFRVSAIVNF